MPVREKLKAPIIEEIENNLKQGEPKQRFLDLPNYGVQVLITPRKDKRPGYRHEIAMRPYQCVPEILGQDSFGAIYQATAVVVSEGDGSLKDFGGSTWRDYVYHSKNIIEHFSRNTITTLSKSFAMFDPTILINVCSTISNLTLLLQADDLLREETLGLANVQIKLKKLLETTLKYGSQKKRSTMGLARYYKQVFLDSSDSFQALYTDHIVPLFPQELSNEQPIETSRTYQKALRYIHNCVTATKLHLNSVDKLLEGKWKKYYLMALVQTSCNAEIMPLDQSMSPLIGMKLKKSQQYSWIDEEQFIETRGHCHGVVMQWAKQLEDCALNNCAIAFYNYHHMHPYTQEKQENQSTPLFQKSDRIQNALNIHGICRRVMSNISASYIYHCGLIFDDGAHSIGFRKVRGTSKIEILDPNFGVFTTDDHSSAVRVLAYVLHFYHQRDGLEEICYSACSNRNPTIESTKDELRLAPESFTEQCGQEHEELAEVKVPLSYPWLMANLKQQETVKSRSSHQSLSNTLLLKIEQVQGGSDAYTLAQNKLIAELKQSIEEAAFDIDFHSLIFEWAGRTSSAMVGKKRPLTNMDVLEQSPAGFFFSLPTPHKPANLLADLWGIITEYQGLTEETNVQAEVTDTCDLSKLVL